MISSTYHVVVTLGPASATSQLWSDMISAGATGFRLNTSHLSLEELEEWLGKIEEFNRETRSHIAVTLDLQGSKWRLGSFTPYELFPGDPVTLVCAASTVKSATLPVPHRDFFGAVPSSDGAVFLDDARIMFQIETAGDDWAEARVLVGGEIFARKGITLPQATYRIDTISERDQAIVEHSRNLGFIRYAVSYIRDAEEMVRYRELLGDEHDLVAKLERQPAVEQAAEVAKYADELWVCRGDMGAELGLVGMAEAVHRLTVTLAGVDKQVLMAGQVLEHMTRNPNPTRSEVCYLHDILEAGYAGIVLSDETAVGAYPVGAVEIAALWQRRST